AQRNEGCCTPGLLRWARRRGRTGPPSTPDPHAAADGTDPAYALYRSPEHRGELQSAGHAELLEDGVPAGTERRGHRRHDGNVCASSRAANPYRYLYTRWGAQSCSS